MVSFSVWMVGLVSHFLLYLICTVLPSTEDHDCMVGFSYFDFAVFETNPMIILGFAVGNIFYVVWKRSAETAIRMQQLGFNHDAGSLPEGSTRKERNSAVKIVGVAVGVFTISYMNELTYSVLYQFLRREPINRHYHFANNLLYLVNSSINPVAYAFFKSDIKEVIKNKFNWNGGNQPITAWNLAKVKRTKASQDEGTGAAGGRDAVNIFLV